MAKQDTLGRYNRIIECPTCKKTRMEEHYV